MTDEEIKKFVQSAILKACDTPLAKFNKQISIVESEEGEVGFQINFNSPLARAEIIYSPQPFLEMLSRNLFKKNYSQAKLNQSLGAIEDTAVLLIRMMVAELESATNLIPYLASELYLKYFNRMAFFSNESIFRKSKPQQRTDIEEVLEFSHNMRIQRILNLTQEVSELFYAPQYIFCDVYEAQAKIWKEASKCYKENKKYKNPLGAVKSNFPDLPDDLIKRFEDLDKETARPSAIALDHTARILNTKTSDRLSRYLTDSKTLRKDVSDEQAQEALDKYLTSISHLTSLSTLMEQEFTPIK